MDAALAAVKHAAPAGIDWNARTAIGMIALADVTVAASVVTIVITAQDRRQADARIRDERDHAREQEQAAEAWAAQVMLTQWNEQQPGSGRDPSVKRFVATVINSTSRTITRIETQFSPGRAEPVLAPAHRFHAQHAGLAWERSR